MMYFFSTIRITYLPVMVNKDLSKVQRLTNA